MAKFDDAEREYVRLKIREGMRWAEAKTYLAQRVAELLKMRIRGRASAR